MSSLATLTDPWLLREDSDDLDKIRAQVTWLSRHLFNPYDPIPFASFEDRLVDWLQNVDDGEDRRTLFRLLGHIFFVGKKQFDALHQCAFSDAVVRWLIDEERLSLVDGSLATRLSVAARRTWFCPITDSMNINGFLKVNQLAGHDVRGDWRSYEALGDPDAIRAHVASQGIKRIVFLEDFVGSGDQLRDTVIFARDTLPNMPMLLAPLICCPEGVVTGRLLARRYKLEFAPTLTLRDELFLTAEGAADEPIAFTRARDLIARVAPRLGDWQAEPYGHSGTGALVAMHSNCPDNTLAIIHEKNNEWAPLFPRIDRD